MPGQEPANTPAPVAGIHLPFPAGGEAPGEPGASGTRRRRTQPTQPAPSHPAPSTACWLRRTTGCPASSPSTGPPRSSGVSRVAPREVHSVSCSRGETAEKTKQRQRPPSQQHQRPLRCEPDEKRKGGLPAGSTSPRRGVGD